MLPTLIAQLGSFEPPVDNEFTSGSDNPLTADENALTNLEQILSNVIGIMTILAGLFFLFQFLSAAITWITSGGDAGQLQTARQKMLHSVIGLIIVVAAYAIIGVIGSIVGLDLINPAATLETVIPQ